MVMVSSGGVSGAVVAAAAASAAAMSDVSHGVIMAGISNIESVTCVMVAAAWRGAQTASCRNVAA